ncbi:hypothetical protein C8R44DRAFT_752563 [Mycena epipterygia]|nr:hypothetical protein C8R44DRAFT_752563 [Mycena epipterygia]
MPQNKGMGRSELRETTVPGAAVGYCERRSTGGSGTVDHGTRRGQSGSKIGVKIRTAGFCAGAGSEHAGLKRKSMQDSAGATAREDGGAVKWIPNNRMPIPGAEAAARGSDVAWRNGLAYWNIKWATRRAQTGLRMPRRSPQAPRFNHGFWLATFDFLRSERAPDLLYDYKLFCWSSANWNSIQYKFGHVVPTIFLGDWPS